MTEREQVLKGFFYWAADLDQVKAVEKSLKAHGFTISSEHLSPFIAIKCLVDAAGNFVNFYHNQGVDGYTVASSIGAIPIVLEGSTDMVPLDKGNSDYLDYLSGLDASRG